LNQEKKMNSLIDGDVWPFQMTTFLNNLECLNWGFRVNRIYIP
jgi:hypothetical protein